MKTVIGMLDDIMAAVTQCLDTSPHLVKIKVCVLNHVNIYQYPYTLISFHFIVTPLYMYTLITFGLALHVCLMHALQYYILYTGNT